MIPSLRRTYLIVLAACTAMMISALVMQYWLEMEPCPLCATQRVFVVLIGFVGLLAWLQYPGRFGRRLYSVVGLCFAAIGGAVSGRHLWLQSLPEDQVPTCGPGLSYMFETLPVLDALSLLFAGDGNCADVVWRFLGLSIPGWTLVCFAGLAGLLVWQYVRDK